MLSNITCKGKRKQQRKVDIANACPNYATRSARIHPAHENPLRLLMNLSWGKSGNPHKPPSEP
jgi:hypothetical protein